MTECPNCVEKIEEDETICPYCSALIEEPTYDIEDDLESEEDE